ncbi:hypothetical protein STAN_6846 [Streptomyces sp. CBMAI 2042]|nr:hypothetical protein STAN_6846 [Streptomyces sp. CBMAI 2042]
MTSRASAFAPASFSILAISALLTVLSTVTTTLPDAASTYQAVPPMSAVRTESAVRLSWVALNVFGAGWADAVAAGTASAATAARPVAPAMSRARLERLWG